MVFSSLTFICVFLPVVFAIYHIIPSLKIKNILLMLASFMFYAYGEPVYVALMFLSCIFNYLMSRLIMGNPNKKKTIAAVAVVVNLGFLGVFKYTDFILETVNNILTVQIAVPEIRLPIGISFFTFQALSYVIDVYRNPESGEKNFLYILIYISFFPQLIAGPIVKYHDVIDQIYEREHMVDKIVYGICRFCVGLGKKVLLANTMAMIADDIFVLPCEALDIFSAWLGAVAYAFQIYYDFSGYSDMAMGLAQMFGFHFLENFNTPYIADGIQDFWHRWHISLSTWFKEYLYIPLGGNRKGPVRTIINRYIVFFCTGLWHGANWTFVLWGLLHGTLLVIENTKFSIKSIKYKWLRQLITFVLVVCAFVLFRADHVTYALAFLSTMFTGFNWRSETITILWRNLTPLNICIVVFCFICMHRWNPQETQMPECVWKIGQCLAAVLLLLLCMMNLASNAYNPFIYFRF